ncbi:MAG: 6-phosphogluconolactonase [Actinomycetota bacterium]|nr:6-phosphogluconolactonase [Actinomycetota bacterium]
MPASPEIVVEATADGLAADVAARVIATLGRAQRDRGQAALALTGGGILEQVFTALAGDPGRSAVEWNKVDVVWGDERFVPIGSEDRNDGRARELLLEPLGFDETRVFAMPASDGPDGGDLERAAARYAGRLAEIASVNRLDSDFPTVDVALIGVGPDGHCCSLFPEHPAVYETGRTVVAVHNSPKPPPERLSLTFDALEACREVWVVAAGAGKAAAVALALDGAGRVQVPAAGARGHDRTLWLVDRAAAAHLPALIYRPPVA